jgi:TetR/AcrR family transcriptional regulator
MRASNQKTPRGRGHVQQEENAVRTRLLKSAIDIFTRRGYAAATVREIVEAVRVTKPVLYYYFGSKEGLYTEIMKGALEKFSQCLADSQRTGKNAKERLHHLFETLYLMAHENLNLVRLIYSIFYGPPQGAPSFFGSETFHERFHEGILNLIRAGIRSGEFKNGNEEVMVSAIEGAFNITIELEMADPERSIGLGGLRGILDLIFDGMMGSRKQPQKGKRHG